MVHDQRIWAWHAGNPQRRQARFEASGFTLVELLTVVAVISVLIGLLLPAVQFARETARTTQCQNHLRQVALATLSHEASRRAFPPARIAPNPFGDLSQSCGGSEPSWLVRLLPYLEEQTAHDGWDVSQPFAMHPDTVRNHFVASWLCPTRHHPQSAVVESRSYDIGNLPCGCPGRVYRAGGVLGDFSGNHGNAQQGTSGWPSDFIYGGNDNGVITSSRPNCDHDGEELFVVVTGWIDRVRMKDLADGCSKTLLAGEKHIRQAHHTLYPDDTPVYDGEHLFASARVGGPGYPLAQGPSDPWADFRSFGSWHAGGCNLAFCDGRVQAVHPDIDTVTLGNLCNREDGMFVDDLPRTGRGAGR